MQLRRQKNIGWAWLCGRTDLSLIRESKLPFVGEEKFLMFGKKKAFFWGKNKKILDAELWAILTALDVALKKILVAKNPSVTIFSDSQRALRVFGNPSSHKENRFLRSYIYGKAKKLEKNGHPVNFR